MVWPLLVRGSSSIVVPGSFILVLTGPRRSPKTNTASWASVPPL